MVSFHSYVKLPEGNQWIMSCDHGMGKDSSLNFRPREDDPA